MFFASSLLNIDDFYVGYHSSLVRWRVPHSAKGGFVVSSLFGDESLFKVVYVPWVSHRSVHSFIQLFAPSQNTHTLHVSCVTSSWGRAEVDHSRSILREITRKISLKNPWKFSIKNINLTHLFVTAESNSAPAQKPVFFWSSEIWKLQVKGFVLERYFVVTWRHRAIKKITSLKQHSLETKAILDSQRKS